MTYQDPSLSFTWLHEPFLASIQVGERSVAIVGPDGMQWLSGYPYPVRARSAFDIQAHASKVLALKEIPTICD